MKSLALNSRGPWALASATALVRVAPACQPYVEGGASDVPRRISSLDAAWLVRGHAYREGIV